MLGVTAAEAQVPNFHDERSLIFFFVCLSHEMLVILSPVQQQCWVLHKDASSRFLVCEVGEVSRPPSIGQNEV